MMEILTAKDSRVNEKVEGFGYVLNHLDEINDTNFMGVSDRLTVCFKPLCGLFNLSKFIPMTYVALSLELELVDNPLQPLLDVYSSAATVYGATVNEFTTDNCSIERHLDQVQVKCDVIS